jgi:hypothetical protein
MFKFLYLANRKADFSPGAFIPRWRQHGALAMSLPFWRRFYFYMQADVVRPIPLAGASSDYDGVSYMLAPDDSLFAHPSAEDTANVQILLEDETKTFRGPIPPMGLVVEENVVKSGARGGMTAFLFFNSVDQAQFVLDTFTSHKNSTRLILNRVREDLRSTPDLVLSYKAVAEISASSLDNLISLLSADPTWREAPLALITQESILWDQQDHGGRRDQTVPPARSAAISAAL